MTLLSLNPALEDCIPKMTIVHELHRYEYDTCILPLLLLCFTYNF